MRHNLGFLTHPSHQHFPYIFHCYFGHSAPSWGLQLEDRTGLLIHEGIWLWPAGTAGIISGKWKTGSLLSDLWLAMQQTVSRVTSRDISIFMATVQVYFSYKFWKIRNKKRTSEFMTQGMLFVSCHIGRCVLIPCGQRWTVILLSYLCFLSSTASTLYIYIYSEATIQYIHFPVKCFKTKYQ